MSGVNFFDRVTDYDFSSLQVYVNDKLTDIPANALTAAAGDDIRIVSLSNSYPFFWPGNALLGEKDYIASIEEPLPFMDNTDFSFYFASCMSLVSIPQGLFDNNPNVTNFSYCFFYCSALTAIPEGLFDKHTNVTSFSNCFSGCKSLASIPEGLFDNNPNVTDFSMCFSHCTSLTSIPQGLFDNNPNVTDFGFCFYGCVALKSIPIGLFDKNTKATHFNFCFNDCTKLTVNVQIGSTTTEDVYVNSFAKNTAATGTVYCRAGSAVYSAFRTDLTDNVNLLTY